MIVVVVLASMTTRKPYPTDITDEEWAFVAPYLILMREDAPQRDHPIREVFNALRWIIRAGASWRMMPNDLPPWHTVYQQTQRWIKAGVFEDLAHDLRALLRRAEGRSPEPTAAVIDSRTMHGSIESGNRSGYDGHKRKKGSKLHMAVDTLGHHRTLTRPMALHVTPANEQERAQVETLAKEVQEVTGEHVELMYADQGYTGDEPKEAAAAHGIELQVVRLPEAKRGFVLLPRRWVVERTFGWFTRFRRLVRDYERLPETVAGMHFVAFICLMLNRILGLLQSA